MTSPAPLTKAPTDADLFREGMIAEMLNPRAARVRHFAFRKCGPGRRFRAGDAARGLVQRRPFPGRRQPARLAVHDFAQHLFFDPPTTRPRSSRQRRSPRQSHRDGDASGKWDGNAGISRRADQDFGGTSRSAAAVQRLRFSYEEASEVRGGVVGTVNSRVNRARAKLAELLGIGGPRDIGSGPSSDGVVKRSAAGVRG